MSNLHKMISTNLGNSRAELDELGDQYFDHAKHKMMKDLVDFNSRDDFEQYMRGLEKNYFDQLNFPKAPYEVFPDFPPKPYQQTKSTIPSLPFLEAKQREEQSKNYIDKALQMNMKRTQAYSSSPHPSQPQTPQSYDYVHQIQQSTMQLNQNPFFDSINKENKHMGTIPAKYTPIGQPNYAVPSGSLGGMYGQMMEPAKVMPPPTPYLQRFIAGPTRLEQNPLTEPSRSFRNLSPSKQQLQMNDYDLKNPDVQFERYKQLMTNQYYNYHANSAQSGHNLNNAHTHYHPPHPFNQMGMPAQSQDIYNMSFSPQLGQNQLTPQQPPPPQPQLSQMYPNELYNRPNSSVSLYNQQHMPQQQQVNYMPGYEQFRPELYRSLQYQNEVDKNIIESLGGIQDTIKPLADSLKQHELRPFYIQKDYRKELKYSEKGLGGQMPEMRPENMKLLSVSPFRAVLKYDEHRHHPDFTQENEDDNQEEEGDEEVQRQNQLAGILQGAGRQGMARNGQSPIRNDSQLLRGQREEFLQRFEQNQAYQAPPPQYEGRQSQQREMPAGQTHQKQYRKMKSQSEHMRGQREGYLNSFSQSRLQQQSFEEGEEEGQTYDYRQHQHDSIY